MTRDDAIEAAKRLVVREAKVEPATLRVRSAVPVTWADAGLGCPREGAVSAAVLTPGYRVMLQASRTLYEVHVGAGRAVLCETVGAAEPSGVGARRPERVPQPEGQAATGEVPEDLLDVLRDDLSKRTGAERASFELVRAEAAAWSDGSLGCPEPDVVYRHEPVSGYRVVLRHDDREYDYRAVSADRFILCPAAPLPR